MASEHVSYERKEEIVKFIDLAAETWDLCIDDAFRHATATKAVSFSEWMDLETTIEDIVENIHRDWMATGTDI